MFCGFLAELESSVLLTFCGSIPLFGYPLQWLSRLVLGAQPCLSRVHGGIIPKDQEASGRWRRRIKKRGGGGGVCRASSTDGRCPQKKCACEWGVEGGGREGRRQTETRQRSSIPCT